MSDMHKFLREFAIVSSCIVFVMLLMFLSGAFIFGNCYDDGYLASLGDKVARLKSLSSPKIILVGNSSLAFGMDSEMLEDAFNMPAVNLGLHGSLGNAFHENVAKLNISSGDLVIICHSTYSDDDRPENVGYYWVTLEYHKNLWDILRPEDYPINILTYPRYWMRSLAHFIRHGAGHEGVPDKEPASAYERKSFNKYGDVAVKPERKRAAEKKIFFPGHEKIPQVNDTCTSRLNELNRYTKERGAFLLVAGYPISRGKYSPPEEEYVKFQRELEEKLDCEVISDFRDYFMPYSYFYDTTLHLTKEGTLYRTSQLIKDIKKWQEGRTKRNSAAM